jgi:hypothetical protein
MSILPIPTAKVFEPLLTTGLLRSSWWQRRRQELVLRRQAY